MYRINSHGQPKMVVPLPCWFGVELTTPHVKIILLQNVTEDLEFDAFFGAKDLS
jgi:hypothetical protein